MKLLARIIALALFPFAWLSHRWRAARLRPAPAPQLVSVRFEMRLPQALYGESLYRALHATMVWDNGTSVTYRRVGIYWYDGHTRLDFMSPRQALLDELRRCWDEQIPHPLLLTEPPAC